MLKSFDWRMATNHSLKSVANDLRLLMLMRNQNRLKTDLKQNHKSPLSNLNLYHKSHVVI